PICLRLLRCVPTRRSSDLFTGSDQGPGERDGAAGSVAAFGGGGLHPADGHRSGGAEGSADRGAVAGAEDPREDEEDRGGGVGARSEEHTSELQSRENLVCG